MSRRPYNRTVARRRTVGGTAVAIALVLILASWARARDAREAVEAFLSHLAGVEVKDLLVQQGFTMYHPDGRHVQLTGEQRISFKTPGRQRVEQTVEGRREVRLTIGDRVWVRTADGRTYEAPPAAGERDRLALLVPSRRDAAALLGEWRALGVRDDLVHSTQVAGRPVALIGAPPGDRESPAVWLDEEYGVVRLVVRERLPNGPGLVDLNFSEHRRLSPGFYFPYRQEVFIDGKLAVAVTVKSVAVNTALPEVLFDPDALRRER